MIIGADHPAVIPDDPVKEMVESGLDLNEAIATVTESLDDETSSSTSPIALVPQDDTRVSTSRFR
jgi:IMP cyclohydrolase